MAPLVARPGLMITASLAIAAMMIAVSAIGLTSASDRLAAAGVTSSTAGVLVPSLPAHDTFNLLIAAPALLAMVWFAGRGSLLGTLLWPGAVFYVLYTYAIYLVGAPFGLLFLAYAALVAVSGLTLIGLLAGIDTGGVLRAGSGLVPARTVGGLLLALGGLTLAQDATGVVATAVAARPAAEPLARGVWTVDLALEVPALLVGGLLLWRRIPFGHVIAPGLLFQFGLTPVALVAILLVQPVLSGAAVDVGTLVGILAFAIVAFVPLVFYTRGPRAARRAQARRSSI